MNRELDPTIHDQNRIALMRRLSLLDSPPEPAFDRIARLAARFLGVPVALVSLVEEHRQWMKSCIGMPEPWKSRRELPLSHSLCGYVVAGRKPFIVERLEHASRELSIAGLRSLGVVSYVGVPLMTADGYALGALCVMDVVPHSWTNDDVDILQDLAAALMSEIERRREQIENQWAMQALRESEERYRLITENTNDLIYMFDRVGRYVYASPSHRQVVGYEPEVLIGTSVLDRLHPDDLAQLQEELIQQLYLHKTLQTVFRYYHANGSWRWFEANITAIDQAGARYFIGVGRDITERKRLEAQFLQAQKMESIGRLAGGVAHDFNNLLTAITGYAELALEGLPGDSSVRADLLEIEKSARRATALTRQLLAFARRQIIAPREINLNDLLLDISNLLRRLIGEDIELVVVQSPDLGLVKVDLGQIEQTIVNLAVNARDAMPQGGKLTIETENILVDETYARQHEGMQPGPYVVLSVSDTGVGMDARVQRHLFEPFFTTKGPGKGTGLGLATCYGIVKQHGGYIAIASQVGQGTTVDVYLPRLDEESNNGQRAIEQELLPRGGETVLLVEDEPSVRRLAGKVLRAQGYTVLEATNGNEALLMVQEYRGGAIELLLTDVIMPQMGGKALAERLAHIMPAIKVLFMSGYTDDSIVQHGVLDSQIAFLQKPFSPATLAHKVRRVLDELAERGDVAR